MSDCIKTFIDTANERIREASEDSKAFEEWLQLIDIHEDIVTTFVTDPETKLTDYPTFGFTTVFGQHEFKINIAIVDEPTIKKLSYDPYFIDVSYLPDIRVTDLQKDDVMEALDAISSFYVDPMRPFAWLISYEYFDNDDTIEYAAQVFIGVLRDFFHLTNIGKPNLKLVIDNTGGKS